MSDFDVSVVPTWKEPDPEPTPEPEKQLTIDPEFDWSVLPAKEKIRLMREMDAEGTISGDIDDLNPGVRVTPDQWARWRARSGHDPEEAWADARAFSEAGEPLYIPRVGVGEVIVEGLVNFPGNFWENLADSTVGMPKNLGVLWQLADEVVFKSGIKDTPLLDALITHYSDIYGDLGSEAGRTILGQYIKESPSEFLSDVYTVLGTLGAPATGGTSLSATAGGTVLKSGKLLNFAKFVGRNVMDPGNLPGDVVGGVLGRTLRRGDDNTRLETILSAELPGDEHILLPAWSGGSDFTQHRAAALAKTTPYSLTRRRARMMMDDLNKVADAMIGRKRTSYETGESIADAFDDWDRGVKADYAREVDSIFGTQVGNGILRNYKADNPWQDTIGKMEELIASYDLPIAEKSPTVARLRALLGSPASGDAPASGLYKSAAEGITLEEMDNVRSKWLQIVRDQRKDTEIMASVNDYENAQVTDAVTSDFDRSMDNALTLVEGDAGVSVKERWGEAKGAYRFAAELKNRKLMQRADKLMADKDYAKLADELVNDAFYRRPDIADALKERIFTKDMYMNRQEGLIIRDADTGAERVVALDEDITDAIRKGDMLLDENGQPADLADMVSNGSVRHGKDERVLNQVRSHYLENLFAKSRKPSEEGSEFSWWGLQKNLADDMKPGKREAIESLFDPDTVAALDAMSEALTRNSIMIKAMEGSQTAWNTQALLGLQNIPEIAVIADVFTLGAIPLDNSMQLGIAVAYLFGRDAYMGLRKTNNRLPGFEAVQETVNAARRVGPYMKRAVVAGQRVGHNIDEERRGSAPLYTMPSPRDRVE